MTENQAFETLITLLTTKAGSLKIITRLVNPDRPPESTPLRPDYFIQYDVVKIEKRDDGKCLLAFAEEGAICSGLPTALLKRLTEWKRDNPPLVLRPEDGHLGGTLSR